MKFLRNWWLVALSLAILLAAVVMFALSFRGLFLIK